ncbi:unnamed protein product [Phytophthora lilii]|uniref:Unnamed protein product n=1 Tax=Phytophthora lilii TaxID=2077276 RepID=A0A9W6X3V8_9STRA|nr:unnamed protein product [Phytophthora lilii]
MTLKYEEGMDLTEFFFEMESAMKLSAEATNSVMSDEQKTLYLYHSLPDAWKPELAVWKGSRKYIPYEDLKRHIETKVHHEIARNRYVLKQVTQESNETRQEKALQAAAPKTTPTTLQAPPTMEAALVSSMKCTFDSLNSDVSLAAHEAAHDPVWTIDSGCTRHVTANPQWFEKRIPTAGKAITVGGNHQIPIKGTGDVKMKIKDTKGKEQIITLNNVLYAPGLSLNLLSVRQAAEDDFKINFPNAKKCVLFFAHRTKIKAKTGEGTGLYQFQASSAIEYPEAYVTISGKPDNILLWHKRMGHPNFRIMQDLNKADTVTDMSLSNFDPNKNYFCSSCTYAKAHRNPFNKRTV